jgi:CubicO group peptidase (beta-lactamase class C family)
MKSLMSLLLLSAVAIAPAAGQTLSQGSPAEAGISAERLARLKPLQEQYVKEGKLAGGTMLIARNGKIVYFDTFGAIDKDTGKPMPKDAIFRIYSMTKPIITVAALTLYEKGKFSLLDPVSKYIPEFANMKVAVDTTDANGKHSYSLVPAERPILIVDLFRHTSGMNNAGPKDEYGKAILPTLNIQEHNLEEGIKLLASAPLVHQPETGFDYSPGPDVIGRLIEIWSGEPLDQYLDEAIFKPLHMVDTGFWVPKEKWNRLTTLYDAGPTGEVVKATDKAQDSYKEKPIFESGAGGLASSTMDYARFAQMLLNGGELEGVRILSPKTVELMSSDMLGDLPVYGGPILPGYGFGLTVAVNRGPGKTDTIGSAGEYYWEGAASSIFFVDPKEKLITVYMIQKRRGVAISREYKRMVYAALETRNDDK